MAFYNVREMEKVSFAGMDSIGAYYDSRFYKQHDATLKRAATMSGLWLLGATTLTLVLAGLYVAAIPLPPSVVLFGAGLLGIVGLGRSRRRKQESAA